MKEQSVEIATCAHPDCKNIVTEDDYCHGCERYICEKCSPFITFGKHEVHEHWEQDEEIEG